MARRISQDNKALREEIDNLSVALEKLRVAYDRYFMGLDRVPPIREREQLELLVRRSGLHRVRQTAIRFRFQNFVQRLTTYRSYWERIMRKIEEGTFRRERDGGPTPRLREVREAAADPMAALYDEWKDAKKGLGARQLVDFDAFAQKMRQMRAQHMAKFGCDDVEYRIKVKDGRVGFVARPIRYDSAG